MSKEKNVADLRSDAGPSVRREVHARLFGGGGQNRAAPLAAVLSQFAEHSQRKQSAGNEDMKQKGIRDQSLGVVDSTNDDAFYRSGVRKQETYARGLEWFNTASQELPQQFADDDDFDYETWRQEKLQEYLSLAETPEEIKVANGQAQRFMESMDATAARQRADIVVRRGTDAIASTALEAVRAGAVRTPEDFKLLLDQGEANVGMGRDETLAVVAPVLLDAIAQGDLALADVARSQLENDPRFGLKLEDAVQRGTVENERRSEEARKESLRTNLRLFDDVERRIDSGTLTYGYLENLIEQKVFTAEEAAGMMSRQRDRQRALAEKASKEANDASNDLDTQRRLRDGRLPLTVGEDNTNGKKFLDAAYSVAALAVEDARESEDESVKDASIAGLRNALMLARKNGHFPKVLTQQMSALDFGNPEAAKRTLSLLRSLQAAGMEDFVRANLPGKAMARLDAFESQVASSGDADQAIALLNANAGTAPAVLSAQLTSVGRVIRERAVDLAGGEFDSIAVTVKLTDITRGYISAGMGAEEAVDRAVQDLEERYEAVNGQLLPRGTVSEDFEQISGDYTSEILQPYLETLPGFPPDSDITLFAIDGKPGQFQVMAVGEYGTPELIFDDNGRALVVDETRMAAQLTATRQNAVVQREATVAAAVQEVQAAQAAQKARGAAPDRASARSIPDIRTR